MEQYNALLASAPLLESVLVKKEIQVARPNYEADTEKAVIAKGEVDEEQRSSEEAVDEEQ